MEQYLSKVKELIPLYNQILSSKYVIVYLVAIAVLTLFQGQIIGWFVMRKVKEVFTSIFPAVNEVKDELLGTEKLKRLFTEEYNYKTKAIVYSFIALILFIQVILMWATNKIDINSSVAIGTLLISLIESRDNIITFKEKKKERQKETSKQTKDFIELSEMGAQDAAKELFE